MENKNILSFSLFLSFFICLNLACTHSTEGLDKIKTISFKKDVQTILSSKCYSCHGANGTEKKKFATYAQLANYIKAGDPVGSDLYQQMVSKWDMMPPTPGEPVSMEDRTIIFAWIKQGALDN